MSFVVRQLAAQDALACAQLRREMLVREPRSFGASPETDRGSTEESVRQRLESGPDNVTFGALVPAHGGKLALVGSLGLMRPPHSKAAHRFMVWGVYVSSDHRRQGLARALLEAAIDYARARPGVLQLDLSVSATTLGAGRLYESLGFRAWGTEPAALLVDGVLHDELHMQLRLEDAAT